MPRSSLFKHPRFPHDIILCAVRWCLRYPLSYPDVVVLLAERGISIDRIVKLSAISATIAWAPDIELIERGKPTETLRRQI